MNIDLIEFRIGLKNRVNNRVKIGLKKGLCIEFRIG